MEEFLDKREIEDILQHLNIVGSGVNDLDFQVSVCLCANCSDIDFWNVGDLVLRERFRSSVDLVGDGLWSGSAIGKIVLDTEIVLWTY